MMPAFPIDQVQQRCRALFRAAQAKVGRPLCFWRTLRSLCLNLLVPDWETLCKAIAFGFRGTVEAHDAS